MAFGFSGDLTEDEPELVLLSLSVRNEARARAFFEDVLLSLQDPIDVDTTTIRGRDVLILSEDDETIGYLAITDGLAILGITEVALARSLGSLDNDTSILDNPGFINAINRVPDDAWVSAYVDGRLIEDSFDEALAELEDVTAPDVDEITTDIMESLASLQSVGIWARVADNAITIEAWAVGDDLGLLGGPDQFVGIDPDVLARLPGDTFLVAGGGGGEPDAFAQGIADAAATDPAVLEDLRQASLEALGIDVFDDLLAGLGNDFFFAVLGDDGSLLAEQGGVSILVGLSLFDAVLVESGLESVNQFVEREFGAQLRVTGSINEVMEPNCGVFEFITCGGWASHDFPVLMDESLIEKAIADVVDKYGREIAVVTVFDDEGRGRTLGAAIADAWGVGDGDGIVVTIDLSDAEVFVYGDPETGLTDPGGAETAADFMLEFGDVDAIVLSILDEIDRQLGQATAGETLGGRTPGDAFALAGQPVFAYGIQDDRLYLATSAAAIASLDGSGSALVEMPSFIAISIALVGTEIVLFGDITTLEELEVMDPGTLPLADGSRLAFGAGLTTEEGAVGFRLVLAIVE